MIKQILFSCRLLPCALICVSVFFSQCKKDEPTQESLDFGYNYFPGEVGSYIIYRVDSIHYDITYDTVQYLLKEKIESSFLDNSNRPTLRIERYKKYYNDSIPYDSMQWALTDIWTATKTTTALEKKEENIIYVKLVFPAKEGKTWNGNVYNNLGEQQYEITSTDVFETINNMSFDSVATVLQNDNVNVIQNIHAEEKFARNVGLIYRQNDSLYFASPTQPIIGYKVSQKIIYHGK